MVPVVTPEASGLVATYLAVPVDTPEALESEATPLTVMVIIPEASRLEATPWWYRSLHQRYLRWRKRRGRWPRRTPRFR